MPTPTPRLLARKLPWLLLLIVIAIGYYACYFRYGINFHDDGATFALGAKRLLDGEVPFRDIELGYNVLWFYPAVGLFKLFGVNFVLLRAYCFTLSVLTAVLAFLTVERVSRQAWLAFIVGLLLVLVPGMTFKNYMPLLAVANIYCLLHFALGARPRRVAVANEDGTTEEFLEVYGAPSWGWLLAGAIVLGLTFLIRIDVGTFFLLIWLGGECLLALRPLASAGARAALLIGGPLVTILLATAVHIPVYLDAQKRGFDKPFVARYQEWPAQLVTSLEERLRPAPLGTVAPVAVAASGEGSDADEKATPPAKAAVLVAPPVESIVIPAAKPEPPVVPAPVEAATPKPAPDAPVPVPPPAPPVPSPSDTKPAPAPEAPAPAAPKPDATTPAPAKPDASPAPPCAVASETASETPAAPVPPAASETPAAPAPAAPAPTETPKTPPPAAPVPDAPAPSSPAPAAPAPAAPAPPTAPVPDAPAPPTPVVPPAPVAPPVPAATEVPVAPRIDLPAPSVAPSKSPVILPAKEPNWNTHGLRPKTLAEISTAKDLTEKALILLRYAPLFALLPLAIWAVLAGLVAWRSNELGLMNRPVAALLVIGGALTIFPQYFFWRSDSPHISEFMPGYWVAAFSAALLLGWSDLRRTSWLARTVASLFILALVAHASLYLWRMLPDRWTGTIAARATFQKDKDGGWHLHANRKSLFDGENGVDVFVTKKEYTALEELKSLVTAHAPTPGDYVVAYPYHPQINLLCNRPTYEKNVYVDNATCGRGWNEAAIARIQQNRPAVIVLSDWAINGTDESRFSVWGEKTKTWIQTNYQLQTKLLEFEIYTRPEKELEPTIR